MRVILYLALKWENTQGEKTGVNFNIVSLQVFVDVSRFSNKDLYSGKPAPPPQAFRFQSTKTCKAGEAGELEARKTPSPSLPARPPLFAARETSANEAAGKRCCRVVYGTILKISIYCFLYLSILHVHPGVGGEGTTLHDLYKYMKAKQRVNTDRVTLSVKARPHYLDLIYCLKVSCKKKKLLEA